MALPDPLIGQKLGDYKIESLLGKGGMARVYKGLDENLDRYAAVKVITSEFQATTEQVEYTERFQKEARAIARLRHPHIVGIYQFGQAEGLYYMAMVFLDGDDLRNQLRNYLKQGQRMPVKDILKMAAEVADALDHAHSHGVIHRDIKPSNIMMTSRGAVLTDFGL
ncbi:MAG: serine/threonine protein kinase, partial [Chloroflexi bacterium]|nr:serine/threonine protein kinase [Chloroflexota bacterium]